MSLTIDGHAAVAGSQGGGTSFPVTLTTTQNNDIIVVMLYTETGTGNPSRTVTGVSGGGLTWHQRTDFSVSSNGGNIGVWWALASAPLSAVTITATTSASLDDYVLIAFGVNGCNLTAPWDTNVSLPAATGGNASTWTNTINTTQPHDLILCFGGHVQNSIPTGPAGFTLIDSASTNAAALDAGAGAWYLSVSSAQTSRAVSIITGGGGSINVTDALTADGTGTLFRCNDLCGLGAGGPFFADPLR